jgi:ribosome-associated toxin RatA of RatAB toxin-antitoxin module
MPTVKASRAVVLSPDRAAALWTDVSRWPTFVEGFQHVVEKDDSWPAHGAKLVWKSVPDGRGTVNERVTSSGGDHLSTRLIEAALTGVQTVTFHPAEDGGCVVEIALEYELNPTSVWRQGPLGKVADALFIRRALGDSLARTLRRFATEAAEESAL